MTRHATVLSAESLAELRQRRAEGWGIKALRTAYHLGDERLCELLGLSRSATGRVGRPHKGAPTMAKPVQMPRSTLAQCSPQVQRCPRCHLRMLFVVAVVHEHERKVLGETVYRCTACAEEYTPDELAARSDPGPTRGRDCSPRRQRKSPAGSIGGANGRIGNGDPDPRQS